MNDRSLLVFLKYPEKGQVKTRLAESIGDSHAIEIYKNFVLDFLKKLENLDVEIYLTFYPVEYKKELMEWLGKSYNYLPQSGEDLGEKMKNAFLKSFEMGLKKTIIVGSDIPDLPIDYINKGFQLLDDNDSVLGPSKDGGYYLIGFRRDTFIERVFIGIEWSTDKVFNETMNVLDKVAYKTYILPEWYDIDTIKDLQILFNRNKNKNLNLSRTIFYLKENNILK